MFPDYDIILNISNKSDQKENLSVKTKQNRFMALVLSLLMISSSLIACSDKEGVEENNEISANTETELTETEAETEADPLENLSGSYNNTTFTILSREETAYEISADEILGEAVNDAVFERNRKVEEKFDVSIDVITELGSWNYNGSFVSRVSNSVLAEDHAFDMVLSHLAYMVNASVNGYGYNLMSLPNVDFTQPWWCEQYFNDCAIDGKIFCGIGDITLSLYEYMECVFFNKTLVNDYQVGDVYSMVKEGAWTLDKLTGYAETCYSDLDGDGKMNPNVDQYAYACNAHANRIMQLSLDMQISKKDEEGKMTINIFGNEKFISAYDKLRALCNDLDGTYLLTDSSDGAPNINMFTEDRIMFWATRLGLANGMREMESDYGIIPFPKYDEAQENYRTGFCDDMSSVFVPKTVQDTDMTGNIMEALCILGRQDIVPKYYEITLKNKYFSDETAAEMLDLIRDTAMFDILNVYTMPLNYPYSLISVWLVENKDNITSIVKAQQKVYEKTIKKLYENVEKNWS